MTPQFSDGMGSPLPCVALMLLVFLGSAATGEGCMMKPIDSRKVLEHVACHDTTML